MEPLDHKNLDIDVPYFKANVRYRVCFWDITVCAQSCQFPIILWLAIRNLDKNELAWIDSGEYYNGANIVAKWNIAPMVADHIRCLSRLKQFVVHVDPTFIQHY